jgi:hypothetical protein
MYSDFMVNAPEERTAPMMTASAGASAAAHQLPPRAEMSAFSGGSERASMTKDSKFTPHMPDEPDVFDSGKQIYTPAGALDRSGFERDEELQKRAWQGRHGFHTDPRDHFGMSAHQGTLPQEEIQRHRNESALRPFPADERIRSPQDMAASANMRNQTLQMGLNMMGASSMASHFAPTSSPAPT